MERPPSYQPGTLYEHALQKAMEVSPTRFNPRDFSELYTPEVVERDLVRVTELKQAMASTDPGYVEAKQQAMALEAVAADCLRRLGWFGPHATAYSTSEFDDYVNGVDEVIEFQRDDATTHLGIAIDVTFSSQLKKKFDRIREELGRGQLAKVKYFQSGPYKGQLEVPRVIVGLDHGHLARLTSMWLDAGKEELMKQHPFRRMIASQIQPQLEVFARFATQKQQDRVVQLIERVRRIFETEVRIAGAVNDDWISDSVHTAILKHAEMFDQAS